MGDGKCLIAEIFQGWISGMGCASHSDFQSEREKVLDELEQWNNTFNLQLLSEKIVELRQAGKP